MQICTIIQNRVFQGGKKTCFYIHCQLRSILPLVKTTKKRWGHCAFLL